MASVTLRFAHRWRGSGVFVRFIPLRGACAPRYYYAAPQDAGLPSSRGSRRGEISTRLQSERSYRRGGVSKRRSRGVAISGSPILRRRAAPTGCKVPDGVSHLFPCTAGALFPEANSLLLPRVSGRSRFPTPRMRGATAIASAWTHRDTDAGTTRPHSPTYRNPWNG